MDLTGTEKSYVVDKLQYHLATLRDAKAGHEHEDIAQKIGEEITMLEGIILKIENMPIALEN